MHSCLAPVVLEIYPTTLSRSYLTMPGPGWLRLQGYVPRLIALPVLSPEGSVAIQTGVFENSVSGN